MTTEERWTNTTVEADEKVEASFQQWILSDSIPFENDSAKALYQERCTLIKEAVQMKKKPARIPIWLVCGTYPLEHSGMTMGKGMYDYEAATNAFLKFHNDFPGQDCGIGFDDVLPGPLLDHFQPTYSKWSTQDDSDKLGYQYVEKEIMKSEDYQDFIDDPTGWMLSVFFPRSYGSLGGLATQPSPFLPVELNGLSYYAASFRNPNLNSAYQKLVESGDTVGPWLQKLQEVSISLMSKGFPLLMGGVTLAPFDVLGDTLRGTLAILKDLYRYPNQVIEACERLVPIMVKNGVQACAHTGNPLCFIPLHKGADGFMSEDQFKTFYWPSLRKLAIGLMENGVVPMLFAEGGYNQRLETISDLPGGKAIWYFDQTDMKRAKETVGKSTCIMGNMPVDILCTASAAEVEGYCQQLIEIAAPGGGFIFSNGASFEGARPENIASMINYMQKYGQYV
jgi:hypothetical protein